MRIYTDWQDVPEGFEPDHMNLTLFACMGQTFITTTLHNCPPAPLLEIEWGDPAPDPLEYREVLPTAQLCSPGLKSSGLWIEALNGRARVCVDLVGGGAGRVDVVLSAMLVGKG